MAVHSQIIVSAKDRATGTFRKISTGIQGMYAKIFNLNNAIGATAVYGFGRLIDGAVDSTDSIGKTADKVGLLTDELQELRYAAALVNVGQSQLDMGMQRFARRLGEVAQGTGELKATSEQYGVHLYDNQGRMRSSMDLLQDWADVIENAESDQEALRIAFKLFDSEGAAMVNMLRDGSRGLNDVRREAHAYGLVIDESLVRKSAEANDGLTRMNFILDAQFKSTLVQLAPDIVDISDSMAEWVRENKEFLTQDVPGHIRDAVDGVEEFADSLSNLHDAWTGVPEDARNFLIGVTVAKWLGIPAHIMAGVEGFGLLVDKMKEWQELEEEGLGSHTSRIIENMFDAIGLGPSDEVKRVAEQVNSMWTAQEEAYKRAAQFDALDPRDRDLGSGVINAPDTGKVVAAVAEMTDQQKRLKAGLSKDIKRMSSETFAFERWEIEQTYLKDLEVAGKREELVALASERRRLSLEGVAEAERQWNEDRIAEETRQELALISEIERATLDSYEARRREVKRYYDDLKARAAAAGKDTSAIEQGKANRLADINREQSEAAAETVRRMQEDLEDVHVKMLESSDSMVDGLELGLIQVRETNRTVAESMADAMQDSMRTTKSAITDLVVGSKFEFADMFNFIQRKAAETFVAEPMTNALFSGFSSVASSLFGSSSSYSSGIQHIDMDSGTPMSSFADGGISYGPQKAWVSEGRYRTEAHVPLPDGRTIPVTVQGGTGNTAPIIIQLVGQDGRVMYRTQAQQPKFDGKAMVTKESVAIRFMQAVNDNTAGLRDYLRGGGA